MQEPTSRHDVCLHHSGLCRDIKSIRESIYTAKAEMDRRLEGMNEFRAQLDKQVLTFLPKQEATILLDRMETILTLKINKTESIAEANRKELDRRAGASTWSTYIITAVVAAVISVVLGFIAK